jgi:hypothetical protein
VDLKLLPQMLMNLAISYNYGLVKFVIISGTFGIQKYSYQWRTCNPTTVSNKVVFVQQKGGI